VYVALMAEGTSHPRHIEAGMSAPPAICREVFPVAHSVLAGLARRAVETIEDAVPKNTRRAYEGDLKRFTAWCTSTGLTAMPAQPETIALYMRALADERHAWATVVRALAAISTAHMRSGHPSPWAHPLVADMRTALARELGTRPKKKKAADDDILRRLLAVVPVEGLLGLRDRAILTLGWCGAFRRSELVSLDVPDVTRVPKGAVVLIGKSKTDQEGRGEEIPIFFSNAAECCPLRSLDAWLTAAGIADGAIFRQLGRRQELGERLSPAAVLDRVKHWAKVAGLKADDFGAHSLRSGFITTAARRGRDLDSIMVTTRHRSEKVARGYIERETLHERGAGEGLL
jgi:site-specific recombinase XerD